MSPELPILVLIIAVPTYFLCNWILTKIKVGGEKNRKFVALIPTIILSPLIYIVLIMIWIFSISYYPTNDFDQAVWTSNADERYRMSADIIDSKMLIGKTREEVIEILGTDFSSNNESRITYELGHVPRMFNIDPDYLEVRLENGFVVGVNQYEG